jgi:hypothetical protein
MLSTILRRAGFAPNRDFGLRLLAPALAALAGACSTTAPASPYGGPDPADAAAPVAPVTDVGVRGAYESARPVEPRSWRERNERVAPERRP